MKRRVELDIMRIVAIFLVLYNHTAAFRLYRMGEGMEEVGYLFMSTIARMNVPLFCLVSGALLMGRTEDYGTLLRKRVWRFVQVIIIFHLLLYSIYHFWQGRAWNSWELFHGMIYGELRGATQYWFLFAYLGMLLMLPFLRTIAQKMTRQDFIYLLSLHFVVATLLPIVNYLTSLSPDMGSIWLSKNVTIPLASVKLLVLPMFGYYLDQHVDVHSLTRKQWTYIALAVFGGLLLSGGMTWWQGVHQGWSQDFIGLTNYITCMGAFLAFKRWFGGVSFSERKTRFICLLGGLSFGVYLLDPCLKPFIYDEYCRMIRLWTGHPNAHYAVWVASIAWCLKSFVICGCVTWILRHLPIMRKIL